STTNCCSAVRSSGRVLNAWKRSAVRCGAGSAARSRVITWPPGLRTRHSATKRSASCDDAPCAPYRLVRTYKRVRIWGLRIAFQFDGPYSTIDAADKKEQILA